MADPNAKSPHYWLLWALAGVTAVIVGLMLLRQPGLLAGDDTAALDQETLNAQVHDYIVNNPEVIQEAVNELQRREQAQQETEAREKLAANRDAVYAGPDALVFGNPEGAVNVAEFFDYNCPYCKDSHAAAQKLQNKDNVRFVHKQFPILSEGSKVAARAALAARKQGKYLPLHNAMMEHSGQVDEAVVMKLAEDVGLDIAQLKEDMQSEAIQKQIDDTIALAKEIGVSGTPTFAIEDRLISGARPYDFLEKAVEEAAAEASQS